MKQRQILNAIYFALAAAFLFHAAPDTPWVLALAWSLTALAGCALFVASNHGATRNLNLTYEFPDPVRRMLRATALVVPLVAVVGVPSMVCCSDYDKGIALLDDNKYEEAKIRFDRVLAVLPNHEGALAHRSYTYNCLWKYTEALADADRAIALKCDDSDAHADRAWALNHLEQYVDAYNAATTAVQLNNGNGEAYASLADASRSLLLLNSALAADNRHCEIHNNESAAFYSRAKTYEALANFEAANSDREHARSLDK